MSEQGTFKRQLRVRGMCGPCPRFPQSLRPESPGYHIGLSSPIFPVTPQWGCRSLPHNQVHHNRSPSGSRPPAASGRLRSSANPDGSEAEKAGRTGQVPDRSDNQSGSQLSERWPRAPFGHAGQREVGSRTFGQSSTGEGELEPIKTEKVGRGGARLVAARWWVRDQLSLLVPTSGVLNLECERQRLREFSEWSVKASLGKAWERKRLLVGEAAGSYRVGIEEAEAG